jgi:hypothetical protein
MIIQCLKKWDFLCKQFVACGYSQVPGIDFNKSFAPVLCDISFRIMLISKLIWGKTCTVIDIETAFLHVNLDEEIYMEVPKALTIGNNNKLIFARLFTVWYNVLESFMRNR